MRNVELKIASKADADSVLKIQYEYYQKEALRYGRKVLPPMLQSLDELYQQIDAESVLIALNGKNIVGSVRGDLNGNDLHIGRLIIVDGFCNQGIGKHLFLSLEEMYSRCSTYSCMTGHRSVEMISFYEKMGYAEYARDVIDTDLSIVHFSKIN